MKLPALRVDTGPGESKQGAKVITFGEISEISDDKCTGKKTHKKFMISLAPVKRSLGKQRYGGVRRVASNRLKFRVRNNGKTLIDVLRMMATKRLFSKLMEGQVAVLNPMALRSQVRLSGGSESNHHITNRENELGRKKHKRYIQFRTALLKILRPQRVTATEQVAEENAPSGSQPVASTHFSLIEILKPRQFKDYSGPIETFECYSSKIPDGSGAKVAPDVQPTKTSVVLPVILSTTGELTPHTEREPWIQVNEKWKRAAARTKQLRTRKEFELATNRTKRKESTTSEERHGNGIIKSSTAGPSKVKNSNTDKSKHVAQRPRPNASDASNEISPSTEALQKKGRSRGGLHTNTEGKPFEINKSNEVASPRDKKHDQIRSHKGSSQAGQIKSQRNEGRASSQINHNTVSSGIENASRAMGLPFAKNNSAVTKSDESKRSGGKLRSKGGEVLKAKDLNRSTNNFGEMHREQHRAIKKELEQNATGVYEISCIFPNQEVKKEPGLGAAHKEKKPERTQARQHHDIHKKSEAKSATQKTEGPISSANTQALVERIQIIEKKLSLLRSNFAEMKELIVPHNDMYGYSHLSDRLKELNDLLMQFTARCVRSETSLHNSEKLQTEMYYSRPSPRELVVSSKPPKKEPTPQPRPQRRHSSADFQAGHGVKKGVEQSTPAPPSKQQPQPKQKRVPGLKRSASADPCACKCVVKSSSSVVLKFGKKTNKTPKTKDQKSSKQKPKKAKSSGNIKNSESAVCCSCWGKPKPVPCNEKNCKCNSTKDEKPPKKDRTPPKKVSKPPEKPKEVHTEEKSCKCKSPAPRASRSRKCCLCCRSPKREKTPPASKKKRYCDCNESPKSAPITKKDTTPPPRREKTPPVQPRIVQDDDKVDDKCCHCKSQSKKHKTPSKNPSAVRSKEKKFCDCKEPVSRPATPPINPKPQPQWSDDIRHCKSETEREKTPPYRSHERTKAGLSESTTPPRGEGTPPKRSNTPPRRDKTPPKKKDTPPRRKQTPPRKEQTPPPEQECTPPRRDETPPKRDKTPTRKNKISSKESSTLSQTPSKISHKRSKTPSKHSTTGVQEYSSPASEYSQLVEIKICAGYESTTPSKKSSTTILRLTRSRERRTTPPKRTKPQRSRSTTPTRKFEVKSSSSIVLNCSRPKSRRTKRSPSSTSTKTKSASSVLPKTTPSSTSTKTRSASKHSERTKTTPSSTSTKTRSTSKHSERTKRSPSSTSTQAKSTPKQNAKSKQEDLERNSSYCLHCANKHLKVVQKNLGAELKKLIKRHNVQSIALNILLQANNMYHINVASITTGESLGCLIASDAAINEAKASNLFQMYLTFFIVDPRNTLSQKNRMLNHSFEIINK